VAPTDPLPIVRFDAKDGQRSLDVMRWGLIPYWPCRNFRAKSDAKEMALYQCVTPFILAQAIEISKNSAFAESAAERGVVYRRRSSIFSSRHSQAKS